jgi:hypothetical protein
LSKDYESMSEVKLTDIAMLENPHCFRNDCGQGYQGGQKFIVKESGPLYFEAGDIIVKNPVPMKYGLQVGSGDLVGYQPIKITQDLVGKTIAVFKSVEIKTINDKPSRDQIIWFLNVKLAGGIAIVLHCNRQLSVEELLAMPRRTDKHGEVKDKAIAELYATYQRRRGF